MSQIITEFYLVKFNTKIEASLICMKLINNGIMFECIGDYEDKTRIFFNIYNFMENSEGEKYKQIKKIKDFCEANHLEYKHYAL